MESGPAALVREYARIAPVPFVPEIRLYQANPAAGLWYLTGGEYRSDEPPAFWAFAWAGGQALARYVLDHPEVVVARSVLDVATGSGVVGIAAAKAGAASVTAVDVDPAAVAAVVLNAAENGVRVTAALGDPLADPVIAPDIDVVLAGDVFYSAAMAQRMIAVLRGAARAGARVLVGDADRGFLPRRQVQARAVYRVPVPHALESRSERTATIWELVSDR